MTTFRKSVSWSKFLMALECPLKLQKVLDKEFSPRYGSKPRAAAMGKLVQRVFELYFNQDMNLQARGLRPVVLERILDKVLTSKWAEEEGIDSSFRDEAVPQLHNGFSTFEKRNILRFKVRSEVKMAVVFDGFRMFGMLDFLVYLPKKVALLDGKGNSKKDADPRQLLYYGLQLHASNNILAGGGFVYWKHGFEPVDLSLPALHKFINGDFAKGRKIFKLLQEGVEKLPATPNEKVCYFCDWRNTCEDSACKKVAGEVFTGIQEVGLGG